MKKRKGLSETRWCELIEQQSSGNQTIAAFCQEHGISENSFYRHKRQMRESGGGFRELLAVSREPGIRIVVGPEVSHIEVQRGFDTALLREVMGALR